MTQQLPLAAGYHGKPALNEANDAVAQGRGFPMLGANALNAVKDIGDLAIGGAVQVSIGRLEHVAMTDLLTSLPNRRAGMGALERAWAASSRFEQALSVLVLDIDHFKRVNDTYGHAVGDKVLIEVAQQIQRVARKDDSVCRLGGEEFLMICPNTDIKAALLAAERLRRTIEALQINVQGTVIRSTVSIGVASREPRMTDSDTLVNAADRALYRAKEAGRNRSCIIVQGRLRCLP